MTTLAVPPPGQDGVGMGNRPACSMLRREVRVGDLPVSCPMSDESLWNAHPRVYLVFDEQGTARCPYCSTEYTLTAGVN